MIIQINTCIVTFLRAFEKVIKQESDFYLVGSDISVCLFFTRGRITADNIVYTNMIQKKCWKKTKGYFSTKEIESAIDTLIATQKIRRIGQDAFQNNESHTGMIPEIPENLRSIINNL